ncbi:MAG: CPBP family intramembrane metalloprotease [Planctomycetales bacterium]|nr:CPBP family intramembrane metalloprotease [Planctomycetales bacterium]
MNKVNDKLLLIGAHVLVVAMILVGLIVGRTFGSLAAVLIVCSSYWASCWALAVASSAWPTLRQTYQTRAKPKFRHHLLIWTPVVALPAITFLTANKVPPVAAILAIALASLINGTTEEMFWRGAFVAAYPHRLILGYVYPTVLFTSWHIALLCLPGVKYEGGAIGLLGGAAILGTVWGLAYWRTRDLRAVSIAHVSVNLFAFTILAGQNWLR